MAEVRREREKRECVREREREREGRAFGVLTFIFLWRLRGFLLLFLLYREFRFRRPLEEARGADVAGRGNGKARERQRRGVSFGFFRIFIILPLLQVCLLACFVFSLFCRFAYFKTFPFILTTGRARGTCGLIQSRERGEERSGAAVPFCKQLCRPSKPKKVLFVRLSPFCPFSFSFPLS